MPTIGCDYSGTVAYFAVSNGERVLHTAKVKLEGDLASQRRNYLDMLTKILDSMKYGYSCQEIMYLEQPWVAGNHFPQTAIKLARNAAYIEVAGLAAGLDVRTVHISSWRKEIYGNGKPTNAKGTAIEWVLYNLGYETKDHNYAEAACIAVFGERQQ